jgi:hypothetical protein
LDDGRRPHATKRSQTPWPPLRLRGKLVPQFNATRVNGHSRLRDVDNLVSHDSQNSFVEAFREKRANLFRTGQVTSRFGVIGHKNCARYPAHARCAGGVHDNSFMDLRVGYSEFRFNDSRTHPAVKQHGRRPFSFRYYQTQSFRFLNERPIVERSRYVMQ